MTVVCLWTGFCIISREFLSIWWSVSRNIFIFLRVVSFFEIFIYFIMSPLNIGNHSSSLLFLNRSKIAFIFFGYLYSCSMNILLIIVAVVLLIGVFWLTVFAIVLVLGPMITGFKKAPYVPSFDLHLRIMKQQLKLKKGAKIVDLGCGDGKALRFFSKEFGLKGTGYDLNPFVIRYGKMLNYLLWYKNIRLIRSDLGKAQLWRYDYVYLYLWPEQLEILEQRLFAHVHKDTVIISNSFIFKHHTPFQILVDTTGKEIIRLYRT